jgi:lysophospholipase L1-like esterase
MATRTKKAKAKRTAGPRKGTQRLGKVDRKSFDLAVQQGMDSAAMVIKARRAKRASRLAGPPKGLLLAEGDSWFDYPFFDVLEKLEDLGYKTESVAHKGDCVEDMAYDFMQLSKLAKKFEDLAQDGKTPRALLVSGGGNDIAGTEFHVLLNHKQSGLPVINDRIVAGILEDRLQFALVSLLTAVTRLSQQFFARTVPILIHGYDFPVPDGRGYLGGFSILPGPWLEPGFRRKGHAVLKDNTVVMADLIGRYNAVLARLSSQPGLGHVKYVDLQGTLSNDLQQQRYKKSWGNELHPSEEGYVAVAAVFDQAIASIPVP